MTIWARFWSGESVLVDGHTFDSAAVAVTNVCTCWPWVLELTEVALTTWKPRGSFPHALWNILVPCTHMTAGSLWLRALAGGLIAGWSVRKSMSVGSGEPRAFLGAGPAGSLLLRVPVSDGRRDVKNEVRDGLHKGDWQ